MNHIIIENDEPEEETPGILISFIKVATLFLTLMLMLIHFMVSALALLPFLGWLNWFVIPFSCALMIFYAFAYIIVDSGRKIIVLVAFAFAFMAIMLGLLRLKIGGGVF